MKLRIISGELKGRTITGPDKDLSFRPTLERTRQSIADMISDRCHGARAADLCAGSGSFGFEMISRGARLVDFVENNRGRATLIRQHAEKFGVSSRCRIVEKDITAFLRSNRDQYDIVFLDPPYDMGLPGDIFLLALSQVVQGGVLLYQRRRPSGKNIPARTEGPLPSEIKTFGDTIVEVYTPAVEK